MLKKALATIVALLACAEAQAQDAHKPGFYVGLEGGLSFFQNSKTTLYKGFSATELSFDRAITAGATVGYDFGRFFRAEFEFNYKKASLDRVEKNFLGHTYNFDLKGDLTSINYMVNGYIQYPVNSWVVPYAGIGIGMADVRLGTGHDKVLAYQAIAGIGANLDDHVTMSMDYRYAMTEPGHYKMENIIGKHDETIKTRLSSHTVMLSLRYKF